MNLAFIISSLSKVISPVIYRIARMTVYRKLSPEVKWEEAKLLTMEEFSALLDKYPYRSDYLFGLVDFTIEEPELFFTQNRSYNRDCDDFAQMWLLWARENGLEAWKVYIADGLSIKSAHAFTIILKNDRFYLCNLSLHGHYSSIEEAVSRFEHEELVEHGRYRDLKWAVRDYY